MCEKETKLMMQKLIGLKVRGHLLEIPFHMFATEDMWIIYSSFLFCLRAPSPQPHFCMFSQYKCKSQLLLLGLQVFDLKFNAIIQTTYCIILSVLSVIASVKAPTPLNVAPHNQDILNDRQVFNPLCRQEVDREGLKLCSETCEVRGLLQFSRQVWDDYALP